jgi:hypothetical protein
MTSARFRDVIEEAEKVDYRVCIPHFIWFNDILAIAKVIASQPCIAMQEHLGHEIVFRGRAARPTRQ